jgi:hypothetical protein
MPIESVYCPECGTPLHTDGWVGIRGIVCALGCERDLSNHWTVAKQYL